MTPTLPEQRLLHFFPTPGLETLRTAMLDVCTTSADQPTQARNVVLRAVKGDLKTLFNPLPLPQGYRSIPVPQPARLPTIDARVTAVTAAALGAVDELKDAGVGRLTRGMLLSGLRSQDARARVSAACSTLLFAATLVPTIYVEDVIDGPDATDPARGFSDWLNGLLRLSNAGAVVSDAAQETVSNPVTDFLVMLQWDAVQNSNA